MRGLVGMEAWQIRLGHGTMVTLDAGDRRPAVGEGRPARGSIHLWLVSVAWRLEKGWDVKVGSDDDGSDMAAGLEALSGSKISGLSFSDTGGDLSLDFEEGWAIRTFRCSRQDDAWRFFDRDGTVYLDSTGKFWWE